MSGMAHIRLHVGHRPHVDSDSAEHVAQVAKDDRLLLLAQVPEAGVLDVAAEHLRHALRMERGAVCSRQETSPGSSYPGPSARRAQPPGACGARSVATVGLSSATRWRLCSVFPRELATREAIDSLALRMLIEPA
jgi:hypothetical protein